MSNLTLASLFDGSGGFPLGGLMNDIIPVWASEIEPYPIRVTTKRLPFMKHYGDVAKINGGEVEPVDIITFGSPCTDLSIAGKRAGLDGHQSVLFFEAIRIVKEMRKKTNGEYPKYIVWENVPGAFSSSKGQDFREVLEQIVRVKDETATVPMPEKGKWMYAGEIVGDGYSVAWRTLDAQYFGVAQRRRRCYLVADFREERAGQILFEFEGLSGYTPQSFHTWQRTTLNAEEGIRATGFDGYNGDLTGDQSSTLGVNCGMSTGRTGVIAFEPGATKRLGNYAWENQSGTLRADMGDNQVAIAIENHPQDSRVKIREDGTVQSLTSSMGMGGGNVPLVLNERTMGMCVTEDIAQTLLSTDYKGAQCICENNPTAYGVCADKSNAMLSSNPKSGFYEADTSRTLDQNGSNPSCNQGGIAVVHCVDQGGGKSACNVSEEKAPTLSCTHGGEPVVCVQGSVIGRADENGPQGSGINEDVSFTLNATDKHAVVYSIDRASFSCGENFCRELGIGEDGVNSTLTARGPSAVALPASFYPQMKAESQSFRTEQANTLVNGTNPGYQNGVVETDYTVRRLTPSECAVLQGFPNWWASELYETEPSEECIAFWENVFETHRQAINPNKKPKSRSQIIKWLKDPHSDSSEYKMWGNGVALPCVAFVLAGIKWAAENKE